MLIDKKSLQTLQILKIKNDDDEFPLPSQYLYINGKECLFINKSRKKYKLCCSPQVLFTKKEHETYFDIIAETEDLEEAIRLFENHIYLLTRVKYELYKPD